MSSQGHTLTLVREIMITSAAALTFLVSRSSFLVPRWRFAPISNLTGGKRRSYRR